MSKTIRKIKQQIEKRPKPINGLYLFTTEFDCVIAHNLTDAKNLLCENLYNHSLVFSKIEQKTELNNLKWEKRKHTEVIEFCMDRIPGWEPEDEDEEENPPYERGFVTEIIDWYKYGVVYSG